MWVLSCWWLLFKNFPTFACEHVLIHLAAAAVFMIEAWMDRTFWALFETGDICECATLPDLQSVFIYLFIFYLQPSAGRVNINATTRTINSAPPPWNGILILFLLNGHLQEAANNSTCWSRRWTCAITKGLDLELMRPFKSAHRIEFRVNVRLWMMNPTRSSISSVTHAAACDGDISQHILSDHAHLVHCDAQSDHTVAVYG